MKPLSFFKEFKLSKDVLEVIIGGDYNTCRAVCYSEMAVGCESPPGPAGDAQFDSCMSSGYNWCDGYCGSGV